MGIFYIISERNKQKQKDQEYCVHMSDDFNDKQFRGYSQADRYIKETEIIKDIRSERDYRTKNPNGTFTKVEVKQREGVDYIESIPNHTTSDNLLNLPTY